MKRALFILLAIAAPLLAMAQPRYTVEKIPMCWTVSAVDSSVTKIVLISSVSDQLITIGYYNADGAEVTVSGGTLAYGYCGTGGGGGGGDDDWRWYVPGDDTYAQPLYRVGKTNIFVTNAADTLHGFRVDSTFQFRMDGGRDIFDWQVGGGTGYDFTPHAGLFYRAPGTFEQNGLGSGHNQITLGLDDSTILSRDRLGAIVFAGRNPSGTGGYRPGAMITAFADGNWYQDSSSTSINFYVTRPNQTTMNNVVTFERGGRVELDYYQTFEDGIPERMMGFTNLSDDMTAHTITGTPGANKVLGINEYNTAMTWKDPGDVVQAETRHIVYQPAHGFTLPAHGFVPVYLDTITGWELALATDSLTLHDSYIVEVISVDTFVLQEAGILRVPAGHGLTPGSDYFLTDVGGIATTPGYHNDWLATVWDTITLALKATRPVLGAVPDTTVYLTDATVFSGDVSGVYNNLQLGTGVVGTTEIANGTITTADLAFTPLQGSGVANQVAVYNGTSSLTGYSSLTFNGSNSLTFNNGSSVTQFFFGNNGHFIKFDPVVTAGQMSFYGASSSRILSLPVSASGNGLIIYPSAENETTTAALRFSTGRSNINNNSHIAIFTNQNIAAGSGHYSSIAIGNGFTPDAINNVSGSTIGGINIAQTYSTPSGTANQAMEYYGLRIAPTINRNALSDDNTYGILLEPTLTTTVLWQGIRNLSNVGYFINSQGTAPSFYAGSLQAGGTNTLTPSARITAVGAGNTSATNSFMAQNLAGIHAIRATDEAKVALGNGVSPVNAWVTISPSTAAGASINVPAGTAPTTPQDGDIWTSSTQKTLRSSQAGITQSLVGTIFTGTSDVTVSNSNTETTIVPTGIGTMTLPANFFTAGKSIKIDMWGIWEADTIAPTFEIRAELGGTLLCTTSAQTMTTCEGGQWHAEILLTCRTTGATGTMFSQGEVRFNHDATAGATHWMRRSTTTTHDTTVSNLLDVTFTANTADPDNLITTTNITVTVLN